MNFLHLLLLFFVTMVGSSSNAVAGGGSFFTVPALIFTGVAPTIANATSTLALWPGSMASTVAYRREIAYVNRRVLVFLVGISVLGSVCGAILLLKTSQATFVFLLPYLILFATCLFAVSDFLAAHSRRKELDTSPLSWKKLFCITFAQLLVAIYCGYFGGGGSIMMVALLALIGLKNIHVVNGLKSLLSVCMSSVAVIIFALAGVINWPVASVMIVGSIIGGYGGAYYARKIDPKWIRLSIIGIGIVLTVYFFIY
ncbi:sulfite exporter TauE/SafE family protein [Dictyobacter arantiisoli]|uniref:Probable membrane transporter protein n=1 Tax=Dictyobacter arantiisoli TaxID=2014874 RepID=A0A5A5TAX3_9CHLR|nr:sulfite exporter TauE/SafE family protein [Dictyobacter arantiisoli]GCF08650.1 UPF0721 transmembrane protein [Dictyobacter arantiisoli]